MLSLKKNKIPNWTFNFPLKRSIWQKTDWLNCWTKMLKERNIRCWTNDEITFEQIMYKYNTIVWNPWVSRFFEVREVRPNVGFQRWYNMCTTCLISFILLNTCIWNCMYTIFIQNDQHFCYISISKATGLFDKMLKNHRWI